MNAQDWTAKLVVLIAVSASAVSGEPVAIDPRNSTMTVRVYKAGILSAFGHDHTIAAPIAAGKADPAAWGWRRYRGTRGHQALRPTRSAHCRAA